MWRDVASLDELVEGRAFPVEVGGEPLMLVRLDGRILAASESCSHDDQSLASGFPAPGGSPCEWECAHHGARFDLETGAATAMPAVAPIAVFPVKVEGGRVWVDVE